MDHCTGNRTKRFRSYEIYTLIFKPKLPFAIVPITKTDETNDASGIMPIAISAGLSFKQESLRGFLQRLKLP